MKPASEMKPLRPERKERSCRAVKFGFLRMSLVLQYKQDGNEGYCFRGFLFSRGVLVSRNADALTG